jgi:phenylalanyl-tRNA synthetase alpha chain
VPDEQPDWETYERDARDALDRASSEDDVEQVETTFLGRKSPLKLALREVRDRETGMRLNACRRAVEAAVADRRAAVQRAELERSLRDDQVDVTLPGALLERLNGLPPRPLRRGHLHLVTQVRREVEDIFLGMGYEIVDGREVETTHYLFDALNMAPGHVTRSPLHSLYVSDDTLLRTETSPAQIHTMEAKQPPIFMVSLGRVYRRDTADATHSPYFHQVEGLAVDRGITLADLKGTLLHLLRALFGEERRARFTTDFFPFTEPSLQVAVSCFVCDGAGCGLCGQSGWIEIGGSGMVDPNVLEFVGYDPEEFSGFAFGWGLERIAILRHGLPDIRDLWNNDLRFLRQF